MKAAGAPVGSDAAAQAATHALGRLQVGDPAGALARLAPWTDPQEAPPAVASAKARALRAMDRSEEAVPWLQALVRNDPGPVAAHNLAAALGDLGMSDQAQAAARLAIDRGGRAPETRLVLARALIDLARHDEAEAALLAAIAARPAYVEALREQTQLRRMRGADPAHALQAFDAALKAGPPDPGVIVQRAMAIRDMIGADAALEALGPWTGRGAAAVEVAAAQVAASQDPPRALAHARAAAALAPNSPEVALTLAETLIGAGDAPAALQVLDRFGPPGAGPSQARAHATYARALRDLAWRRLDDPRAVDPAAVVRTYDVPPPPGEGPDWLTRLAAHLSALHVHAAEPLAQSVRGGSQIVLVPGRLSRDPVVAGALAAFAPAIDAYLAEMEGGRPSWSMAGAWSVRLRAGGGHVDHVHTQGRLSSAFYVAVPPGAGGEGGAADADRRGWLRFGAAGVGPPGLFQARHWVRPRPGRLALFPSWLWHGVEPFAGEGERITIAFDVRLTD